MSKPSEIYVIIAARWGDGEDHVWAPHAFFNKEKALQGLKELEDKYIDTRFTIATVGIRNEIDQPA